MIGLRKNLCNFFVLSLLISCAFATEEQDTKVDEKKDESEKKDEKTVSKRGAFHFSTHGHAHPAIVSASHYHLPPAVPVVAKYPVVHRPIPVSFAPVPVAPVAAPHYHIPPPVAAPHYHIPPPVAAPHYHISPGGASVTSYSVNYPRYPVLTRPAVPVFPRPFAPAFAPGPPVLAAAAPALIPAHHHHHVAPHHHHVTPHHHHVTPHHHAAEVPNCHAHTHFLAPRPAVPVAIPYPGIRHPKYPVFFNQPRPVFANYPQYIPVPTPTFVPVAVPSHPQPASPPVAINPGTAQDTNLNPATQEFPTLLMPTQPTFVPQPTMPTMTSHGWRPIVMMTQHHHRPQATQTTFTNKPPYNYHAPAVAFNHDQPSSTNDIVSGHGQMSGQLAHQLALYQHQQQLQHQQQQQQHYQEHQQQQQYVQQQEDSFPYPAAAETFQQNYDQPSNSGQYQGLSSYQVPIHH